LFFWKAKALRAARGWREEVAAGVITAVKEK
jgi:hypothetical protein